MVVLELVILVVVGVEDLVQAPQATRAVVLAQVEAI
jgi:hypothetical protein